MQRNGFNIQFAINVYSSKLVISIVIEFRNSLCFVSDLQFFIYFMDVLPAWVPVGPAITTYGFMHIPRMWHQGRASAQFFRCAGRVANRTPTSATAKAASCPGPNVSPRTSTPTSAADTGSMTVKTPP